MSRPDKMVKRAKDIVAEARRLRDECERFMCICAEVQESAQRLMTTKLEVPPLVRERAKARAQREARRKAYADQT